MPQTFVVTIAFICIFLPAVLPSVLFAGPRESHSWSCSLQRIDDQCYATLANCLPHPCLYALQEVSIGHQAGMLNILERSWLFSLYDDGDLPRTMVANRSSYVAVMTFGGTAVLLCYCLYLFHWRGLFQMIVRHRPRLMLDQGVGSLLILASTPGQFQNVVRRAPRFFQDIAAAHLAIPRSAIVPAPTRPSAGSILSRVQNTFESGLSYAEIFTDSIPIQYRAITRLISGHLQNVARCVFAIFLYALVSVVARLTNPGDDYQEAHDDETLGKGCFPVENAPLARQLLVKDEESIALEEGKEWLTPESAIQESTNQGLEAATHDKDNKAPILYQGVPHVAVRVRPQLPTTVNQVFSQHEYDGAQGYGQQITGLAFKLWKESAHTPTVQNALVEKRASNSSYRIELSGENARAADAARKNTMLQDQLLAAKKYISYLENIIDDEGRRFQYHYNKEKVSVESLRERYVEEFASKKLTEAQIATLLKEGQAKDKELARLQKLLDARERGPHEEPISPPSTDDDGSDDDDDEEGKPDPTSGPAPTLLAAHVPSSSSRQAAGSSSSYVYPYSLESRAPSTPPIQYKKKSDSEENEVADGASEGADD